MMPCSLLEICQCSGGMSALILRAEESATWKQSTNIVTAGKHKDQCDMVVPKGSGSKYLKEGH